MTGPTSEDTHHGGQVFRASFLGSFAILTGAALTLLWSGFMLRGGGGTAFWQAVIAIIGAGSVLVVLVMIYRLLWRPVMVRVDVDGLHLKNYDATIPWAALEGARICTVTGFGRDGTGSTEVVEFVPLRPLHPELDRGKLKLGQRANAMAGLPDYCFSMTGIDGDNAMLLAAISLHLPVLPTVQVQKSP